MAVALFQDMIEEDKGDEEDEDDACGEHVSKSAGANVSANDATVDRHAGSPVYQTALEQEERVQYSGIAEEGRGLASLIWVTDKLTSPGVCRKTTK